MQIHQLSVSVDSKPILDNISLNLEFGTTHALMGPNGSGKSTLSYAIAGHPDYRIENGSLSLNGQDILTMSPWQRAQIGIFLTFQNPISLPGVTVFSFIKEAYRSLRGSDFDMIAFEEELFAAMDKVGLPRSYLYRSHNEGFSGGEKKRLEVVQILVLKPRVLILDEIDSGLDVDALMQVAGAINDYKKEQPDLSILIITHYQRILRYIKPNYVHILRNGSIMQSGTEELAIAIDQKGYDAI
jgi:Fe-S cluster assembly ATP-binding protein